MKKLFPFIICCALILSFSLVTFAANNKGVKPVKPNTQVHKENVQPQSVTQCVYQSVYAREGFIRSISATQIVVGKKNKADETLTIGSFTVFKNVAAKQKTAKLSDLKVGMKVLVMFDKDRKATVIKILPQKVVKENKPVKPEKVKKQEKTTEEETTTEPEKPKVKNEGKNNGNKNGNKNK